MLGNKSDIEEGREVTSKEAHDLAKAYEVEYMECSAKTAFNIDLVFKALGKEIKKTFIDSHDLPKEKEKDSKVKIKQQRWRQKCC